MLRAIRFEARRAYRSLKHSGMDEADVYQDLAFHFLLRQEQYNNSRSSPATFATRICRNKAAEMVRAARAEKRGGAKIPASLSDDIKLDNGKTIQRDAISTDVHQIRAGGQSRAAAELQELAIDTDRILQSLPRDLIALARVLSEGETSAEASRRLGISKSTLYRRLACLRDAFTEAGLTGRYHGVAA